MNNSDYNMKSPGSVKSDDIDNMSHSDDIDDDTPSPPQHPLSLTTHERNHLSPNGGDENRDKSDCNDSQKISSSSNPENNSNGDVDIDSSIENNAINADSNGPNDTFKTSLESDDEDLDMDDSKITGLQGYRSPSPGTPRRDFPITMVPSSMFPHSFMYMSQYMPGGLGSQAAHLAQGLPGSSGGLGGPNMGMTGLSNEERRKRNRTFIDPVSEVPKLERWFETNTHPSHNQIQKYTEELNKNAYR